MFRLPLIDDLELGKDDLPIILKFTHPRLGRKSFELRWKSHLQNILQVQP
jgi:hypothetical protein